jgi:hypothetical protein
MAMSADSIPSNPENIFKQSLLSRTDDASVHVSISTSLNSNSSRTPGARNAQPREGDQHRTDVGSKDGRDVGTFFSSTHATRTNAARALPHQAQQSPPTDLRRLIRKVGRQIRQPQIRPVMFGKIAVAAHSQQNIKKNG